MMAIPFSFFIAEVIIFFASVNYWGFWNTILAYFVPCALGLLIVSVWGRLALVSMQISMAKGEAPTMRLAHSAAILVAGVCFLIPSFFLRIIGLALFLPGIRHFIIWKYKKQIFEKMSQQSSGFSFGGIHFRSGGPMGPNQGGYTDISFGATEREVYSDAVLDVQPLEITHEKKNNDESN